MDAKTLEVNFKYYLDLAVTGIKAVQANPTVQAIEANWPQGKALAADVVAAIPYVGETEIGLDILLQFGPLFGSFAKVAGIKPADVIDFPEWEDSSDPSARQE